MVRRAGCLIGLLAALCGAAAPGADERLIDQYGHPVSAADFSGHWLLIYFGYSTCPDVCPTSLTTLAAVLKLLGPEAAAVEPLFVSFDSAHDTPAVLEAYAAHFSPRLRALTGSEAAIADAARTFGVPWRSRAGGTGFDHGMFLYLVSPDGRVVESFHPQLSAGEIGARVRTRMAAGR